MNRDRIIRNFDLNYGQSYIGEAGRGHYRPRRERDFSREDDFERKRGRNFDHDEESFSSEEDIDDVRHMYGDWEPSHQGSRSDYDRADHHRGRSRDDGHYMWGRWDEEAREDEDFDTYRRGPRFEPRMDEDRRAFAESKGFGGSWGGRGNDYSFNDYETSFVKRGHTGKGPKGWKRSDERIKEEICEALFMDHHVDASKIDVDVENGVAYLRGFVENRQMKRSAEEAVEYVSGVEDVQNYLRVEGPTGDLTGQSFGKVTGG